MLFATRNIQFREVAQAVPERTTVTLLGIGFLGLGWRALRKRRLNPAD